MPRSTDLHMSYTVSAATDTATMASISTPVLAVIFAWATISKHAFGKRKVDLNRFQGERMTQGNQVRRPLGGHDPSQPRHFENVSFSDVPVLNQPQRLGLHSDSRAGPSDRAVVTGFSETFTMRLAPLASKCESGEVIRNMAPVRENHWRFFTSKLGGKPRLLL